MSTSPGEKLTRADNVKRRYLLSLRSKTGLPWELERRKGSRWARTPSGDRCAILASTEASRGAQWWFGLSEKEFHDRAPLAIVLLCLSGDDVTDLVVPADRVKEFLPYLSREHQSGERKLNVFRRGERYVLPVPSRPDVDLTETRGNYAWLRPDSSAPGRLSPDRAALQKATVAPAREGAGLAFFARVRKGLLEPLDETGLADGDLVLVRAIVTRAVSANAAIRRIVARGGPGSLPADFAEQHDHYARGAARR